LKTIQLNNWVGQPEGFFGLFFIERVKVRSGDVLFFFNDSFELFQITIRNIIGVEIGGVREELGAAQSRQIEVLEFAVAFEEFLEEFARGSSASFVEPVRVKLAIGDAVA
jgi:hypothetical protein